uniref:LysM peptidoglycan-binding domain-containing protein n=1 Tax=Fodinicola feengrottensis TaxID=435914 RepID=UPI0013D32B62
MDHHLALFLLDVVTEITNLIRRTHSARGGPLRFLARILVGAIAAAIVAESTAAIAAPTPATPTTPTGTPARPAVTQFIENASSRTSTLLQPVGSPTGGLGFVASTTERVPSREIYVVQSGDNLWNIAKHHLGPHSGNARIQTLVDQIFALNKGIHQRVGGRLTDPDEIEPGWKLRLPATPRLNAPGSNVPQPRPRQPPQTSSGRNVPPPAPARQDTPGPMTSQPNSRHPNRPGTEKNQWPHSPRVNPWWRRKRPRRRHRLRRQRCRSHPVTTVWFPTTRLRVLRHLPPQMLSTNRIRANHRQTRQTTQLRYRAVQSSAQDLLRPCWPPPA